MTFKPGESGNPNGRPKGTTDRRTVFRDMVEPHSIQLVNHAVEMALSGNEAMLRLLLDRLLPAKPKDEPLDNLDLSTGSLVERSNNVLSGLDNGTITPHQGNNLLRGLRDHTHIVEIDVIVKELRKLQEQMDLRNKANQRPNLAPPQK